MWQIAWAPIMKIWNGTGTRFLKYIFGTRFFLMWQIWKIAFFGCDKFFLEVTKRQSFKVTKWQSDKVTKLLKVLSKTLKWQSDKVTKTSKRLQVTKTSSYKDFKVTKLFLKVANFFWMWQMWQIAWAPIMKIWNGTGTRFLKYMGACLTEVINNNINNQEARAP